MPAAALLGSPVRGNGKYWVFYGSLTSQAYQVEVSDTTTFVTKTYTPPAAHCGQGDTAAF